MTEVEGCMFTIIQLPQHDTYEIEGCMFTIIQLPQHDTYDILCSCNAQLVSK